MNQQLDLALAARDEALAKVEANAGPEWMASVLRAIDRLPAGWRGTGETIRLQIKGEVVPPHHHNAWGPVARAAIKKGLIFDTGTVAHMATKKSHARRSPVYQRTLARLPLSFYK